MDAVVVREGLFFGECPRWHGGRLWYSDFYDHAVHSMAEDGSDDRVELSVPQQPSGLGWLPNGDLLVVSMLDRLVLDATSGVVHADLSGIATFHCNDMVVDAAGRAYVGNFGFDLDHVLESGGAESLLGPAGPPATSKVACVQPDGSVSVAAEGIQFPNGTVITPDGRTMVMAETLAMRLLAFDVDPETGALSNQRVWADLRSKFVAPDGICLDAEGAVWVANALQSQVLRVGEGGEVLDVVSTSQNAYACMLGGDAGTTLFAMTAPSSNASVCASAPQARIETASVSIPHAGRP